MRRGFLVIVGSALLFSGCGSNGWTEEQGQKFVADCISKLQLDDLSKKQAICECWYERTAETYGYDVVQIPTKEMGRIFIGWGKECSAKNGVVATVQRPGEAPGAQPGAKAPQPDDPNPKADKPNS